MATYRRTPPTSLGAQTRTRPVSRRWHQPRLGQVALLQLDCGGRLYAVEARQPLALPLRAVAGAARPQRRRQDLEILVKVTVPTQRRHHHRHRGLPPEVLLFRGRAAVTEVDEVVPEYAQTAARAEGARWKQARLASALRRRASSLLVAGCGEVRGVGFQPHRQAGERATPPAGQPCPRRGRRTDLGWRLTGRRGVDSYSSPVRGAAGGEGVRDERTTGRHS
jgi:hypothetical protein